VKFVECLVSSQIGDWEVTDYVKFIQSKSQLGGDFGFKPTFIHPMAYDFQSHIVDKSVRKGRSAIFADCGLGKTLMQLTWAENVNRHTNKPVLILSPLMVAAQTVEEAEKFNIEAVRSIAGEIKPGKGVITTNYERLHLFDPNDFSGIVADESSILKNFDGARKSHITEFMKKAEFRLLCSATPSPNDYIELGTSSEALGHMGYMDMLGKFFKNNQNSVDSNNRNIGEKFYLKPHAENDFFAWVNQWAMMVKMPSDIGFSNDRYILPELIVNKHVVENKNLIAVDGQLQMFNVVAKNFNEIRHEQKNTEGVRCEKAIELASGKTSVYWCNTNNESKLLREMDSNAIEIIGSQSIEKKEEILLAFANGEIERLITKAKMTSMGLNWQHCQHSVFFPTWSYEQYYQAIRRFWRFGQTKDVTIDMVISDGQTRVVEALQQKTQKAIELHENLTRNVNRTFEHVTKEFNKEIIKPSFL